MKMSTEQEEAEAAESARTDAAAMENLLNELPSDTPAPAPEPEPPPPAEPPPQPPAEPPQPPADLKPKDTPADQDDFEKDLGSDKYELPAGATKQSREIIKIVKGQATEQHNLYKNERTAHEKLQREHAELQTKLVAAAKDSEELARYKPIVERLAIETNPKFNAEYDGRIAAKENEIITKLVQWGLPEKTAEYIMRSGGPAYFSGDSASQTEVESEDGSGREVRMSHKEFWEKRIVSQLSEQNQSSIRLAFDDEIRLKDAKDAHLRKALSNREEYFKTLEADQKKEQESFKAAVTKELESQRKELGEIANEREIPKDAAPELRKEIEAHNALIKDAVTKFDNFFFDTSPQALVKKSIGGLLLDHVKTLLAQKDAKIAAVQAQLDALQKKWDASVKAAKTSHRQSVQQQAKPISGIETETNDGARMEKMLQELPA